MKRRLNMAAALVHDPALILLDEPTVGVDPQSRNAILDRVVELRGAERAVVYTTHYMDEAARICDRIAIVDHGRMLALGTVPELVARHGGDPTLVVVEGGRGAADPHARSGRRALPHPRRADGSTTSGWSGPTSRRSSCTSPAGGCATNERPPTPAPSWPWQERTCASSRATGPPSSSRWRGPSSWRSSSATCSGEAGRRGESRWSSSTRTGRRSRPASSSGSLPPPGFRSPRPRARRPRASCARASVRRR